MNNADATVYEKLIGLSLRFVSYRPRGRKEIETYLVSYCSKRHISAPTEIARVMDRLAELHYIDDEAFVRWWFEQRSGRKPKGNRQIERELLAKGVDKDVVRNVMRQMSGDAGVSERVRALKAAHTKLRVLSSFEPKKRIEKLVSYLSRNGFSWDIIRSVVDEVASD